jgi:hypothetical protein
VPKEFPPDWLPEEDDGSVADVAFEPLRHHIPLDHAPDKYGADKADALRDEDNRGLARDARASRK